jgi:hypothetical protein
MKIQFCDQRIPQTFTIDTEAGVQEFTDKNGQSFRVSAPKRLESAKALEVWHFKSWFTPRPRKGTHDFDRAMFRVE